MSGRANSGQSHPIAPRLEVLQVQNPGLSNPIVAPENFILDLLIYKYIILYMKVFKRKPNHRAEIAAALTQIYGELNRLRLIAGDKKRAKWIEEFDATHNYYAPFFGESDKYSYFKNNPKKK